MTVNPRKNENVFQLGGLAIDFFPEGRCTCTEATISSPVSPLSFPKPLICLAEEIHLHVAFDLPRVSCVNTSLELGDLSPMPGSNLHANSS